VSNLFILILANKTQQWSLRTSPAYFLRSNYKQSCGLHGKGEIKTAIVEVGSLKLHFLILIKIMEKLFQKVVKKFSMADLVKH
jgi:hypothetical protein